MSIGQKMDCVLNKLYDKNVLHENKVNALKIANDSVVNFDTSENRFVIDSLLDGGYIKVDATSQDPKSTPGISDYSLTVKGVTLKRKGGFVKELRLKIFTSWLTYIGGIAATIAAGLTIHDLVKKNFLTTVAPTVIVVPKMEINRSPDNRCHNNKKNSSTNKRVTVDLPSILAPHSLKVSDTPESK